VNEYSEEYMKGFEAAKAKAEGYVQEARRGDADGDYRCIAYRILSMKPGINPSDEDEPA
jgi:hypothetical protein